MLKSGEIRHYNYGEQQTGKRFYLSKKSLNQDWQTIEYPDSIHYADRSNPLTGTMIRLFNETGKKVYCVRYNENEEGTNNIYPIFDKELIMIKPPVFIRGGKRILVATQLIQGDPAFRGARVLYSDDDGRTWKESDPVQVPNHKKDGFHKGTRWNHGAVEPTVIELNDGRIWMIKIGRASCRERVYGLV